MRALADGRQLALTVENTGKPLLPDQLAHLFEPFTPFSENGNGLGLWICYQIATQLGGTIRAESVPGLTQFTVTLPIDSPHDANAPQNLPD
jgi:signal transduction histidine kinase